MQLWLVATKDLFQQLYHRQQDHFKFIPLNTAQAQKQSGHQ